MSHREHGTEDLRDAGAVQRPAPNGVTPHRRTVAAPLGGESRARLGCLTADSTLLEPRETTP
ncbi:hypothetical protein [Streptomyces griseochromogenes]|uniref:hypothetical protein n=1 Tax=Streptomyces griseochromogenes TaxID=68214 RepID=UPI00378CACA1